LRHFFLSSEGLQKSVFDKKFSILGKSVRRTRSNWSFLYSIEVAHIENFFAFYLFSIDRRVDQIENAITVVADRIEEVMAKLEEVEQHRIQESEFGNELDMDVSIKSLKQI
jgi:hypothetical protein